MNDSDAYPIIKSGQGRDDDEIQLEMRMCVILAIALILFIGGSIAVMVLR